MLRPDEGGNYTGPRDVWGVLLSLKYIKYIRVRHLKIKKKQRGPAKMFPRVPLCLSTGLNVLKLLLLKEIPTEALTHNNRLLKTIC